VRSINQQMVVRYLQFKRRGVESKELVRECEMTAQEVCMVMRKLRAKNIAF